LHKGAPFDQEGRKTVMLRKNFVVLVITVAAAVCVGGSPLAGVNLARDNDRDAVSSSSLSEPTSLLLFGAGLWVLARIRRQRSQHPVV
jgi:hypothetical protein